MARQQVGLAVLDQEGECDINAMCNRIGADSPLLASIVQDVSQLAFSAGVLFRGIYPQEAPYFWRGEGLLLPWHSEYWSAGKSGSSTPRPISHETGEILEALLPSLTVEPQELQSGRTYLSAALCASPRRKVQGLAVETMWCVDQCLLRLTDANCPIAMYYQSVAYQNLLECLGQAQLILGFASANA